MVDLHAFNLAGWTKIVNGISKGLHDGSIQPEDLNKDAILKTYNNINKGAADSYGNNWSNFDQDQESLKTVQSLKKNIYLFSGAKTYAMQQEMNNLLHKDGKLKPYNEFKTDALKLNPTYNKNYLQAEHQTARSTANHVKSWQQFQANKDIFPNLRYKTVGDSRVREVHENLNDIIKPIDDPFWDAFYPPNGFRCRCYASQTTDTSDIGKINPRKNGVTPQFQQNAAKSGQIYNANKHPYFALAKAGGRKVAKEMELSKNNAPYETAYKSSTTKATVKVNPFADTKDLKGNFQAAVKIADKLGLPVKIRPHLDGMIVKNQPNPEYQINGKLGERKSPQGGNFKNLLKKAAKQNVEVLVLDLKDSGLNIEQAKTSLNTILKNKKNHPKIKEVILISKDKNDVVMLKRKDFK